jgi:hypothetical protein
MKKSVLTIAALLLFTIAKAQTQPTVAVTKDTVVVKKERKSTVKFDTDGVSVSIGKVDSVIVSKTKQPARYPRVNFGFNFEHFDLGLSKYHNGGNFSEPTGYEFLEHHTWKTHTFGFDALQFGLRFSPNFKIMLSAGIDWNHISLKRDDVDILPNEPELKYIEVADRELKKNRLSSRYVRLPLYFEYRTAQLEGGKRFSIVAGPEVGFLIDGKVKQKTEGGEKTKVKDDFNFEPFRYGVNARIGYGTTGLFFKYYFNDVFAENQGPSEYKNLSFGLTFGF